MTPSRQSPVSNPLHDLLPQDIEGFEPLAELALDMRWSWNHTMDEIGRTLDTALWDLTHNPWVVLQTVSRDRLKQLTSDPGFRKKVDDLLEERRRENEAPAWFQNAQSESPLTCVAYFSMEFMLSEALPIYSGGLGNVAGDQLKSASDLGVPVVGIGLLYQQGYFRQVLDRDGAQEEFYPYNDPGQLPITPVRENDGEWLRLEIKLPGYSMWLRVWQAQVGRVKLYLLDANDPANLPAHRGITNELYGGGQEQRLQQEMALGLGGWRLLERLGVEPEVCHLNEGHAALAVLARAATFMEKNGTSFEEALAATRPGNVFTTHTAVPAGFDRFPAELATRHLKRFAESRLKISIEDLLALGRQNPHDGSESFNMAYLAIRGCGQVNGVSRLHGEVSRRLFQPLFSRWPREEVPVSHVTNGVHMPSWTSAEADALWTEICGKECWQGTTEHLEAVIRSVPDERLWKLRSDERAGFLEYARQRLAGQLGAEGASDDEIEAARHLLDPGTLTLGFARRFASYKRPTLLLHDRDRLLRILTNTERPVQVIVAGKAHPGDQQGRAMVQEWIRFIRQTEARSHVIFLSDYDMLLTEQLVRGVDVWVNTPRRPWEASGTSGMKVLPNGGLNISELDGWWAEAYSPQAGWALGDGQEHGEDPAWDAAEANALYDLLESQVIPEFYTRDERGIPFAWVGRIRESIARLTPQFSANRAVREYTEQHYLPAAQTYRERAADKGAIGKQIVDWRHDLEAKWPTIRFGAVRARTEGDCRNVEAEVIFGDLDPNSVRVELYAEGLDGGAPTLLQMARAQPIDGVSNGYLYRVSISSDRPQEDYTPRIVPERAGVSVPIESNLILWQR